MVIFDEEKYAKELIRDGIGENDKFAMSKLRQIAKYYLIDSKYRDFEIKDIMKRIAADYYDGYSNEFIGETISSIFESVKQSIKDDATLRKADVVDIRKEEMDTISAIESEDVQRVAFAFLVFYKYRLELLNKNALSDREKVQYLYCENAALFRCAGLYENRSGTTRQRILQELRERGLVEFKTEPPYRKKSAKAKTYCYSKSRVATKFKVLFYRDCGEIAFTITNFQDIIAYLLLYKGDSSAIICQKCGCPIVRTSPARKFCANCATISKREIKRP